jgi:hypothetical protein
VYGAILLISLAGCDTSILVSQPALAAYWRLVAARQQLRDEEWIAACDRHLYIQVSHADSNPIQPTILYSNCM